MPRQLSFRGALSLPVLLCACAALSGQTGPATLHSAQQAFNARQLSQAESETRSYLTVQPHSADAMYLLGRILEARAEPKESLEWFTRAAAAAPPRGEDLRVVGMDYVLLNDYPDALHWLGRSVELDPANADAWYDLGRARMMQGDLHSARQPLERSLALRPRQSRVANNLGVVAEVENQPAQAEARYREALLWQQQEPHQSEQPLLNLGRLLLTNNRAAEALPLLQQAAALQSANTLGPPDKLVSAQIQEQLARAQERLGNPAEAVTALRKAVALQPESAHLHYQLGQMLRRTGHAQEAADELKLSATLYGTHSAEGGP